MADDGSHMLTKFPLGAIADRIGAFRACVCPLVTTLVGLVLILLNLDSQQAMLASGSLFGTRSPSARSASPCSRATSPATPTRPSRPSRASHPGRM